MGWSRHLFPSLIVAATLCVGQGRGQGVTRTLGPRDASPLSSQPRMLAEVNETKVMLEKIWPGRSRTDSLAEIGLGVGIIFIPDLSVPGNRLFYEKLGFAYFESADWRAVLGQIQAFNRDYLDNLAVREQTLSTK